jgi:hypothetical protein
MPTDCIYLACMLIGGCISTHRSATYTYGKKMAGSKLFGQMLVHRKIHYTLPYTSNNITL